MQTTQEKIYKRAFKIAVELLSEYRQESAKIIEKQLSEQKYTNDCLARLEINCPKKET